MPCGTELFAKKSQGSDSPARRGFSLAGKTLEAVPQNKDYGKIVVQLVREGIAEINASEVEILADPASRKILAEPLLTQIGTEMHVRLFLGNPLDHGVGVILQTPKGHLQFDNTLQTRLARLHLTLRAAVYGILMGESR